MSRTRAVLLTGAIGAALLLVSLLGWLRADLYPPPGTGDEILSLAVAGRAAAPEVASIGLVLLAIALVLGLSGRVLQRIVLVGYALLGVLGVVALVSMFGRATPIARAAALAEYGAATFVAEPAWTLWPYLEGVLCVLAVAAAVLVLLRAAAWPPVGRRYERDAAPKPARGGRMQAIDDWDALSRGEDPSSSSDR